MSQAKTTGRPTFHRPPPPSNSPPPDTAKPPEITNEKTGPDATTETVATATQSRPEPSMPAPTDNYGNKQNSRLSRRATMFNKPPDLSIVSSDVSQSSSSSATPTPDSTQQESSTQMEATADSQLMSPVDKLDEVY